MFILNNSVYNSYIFIKYIYLRTLCNTLHVIFIEMEIIYKYIPVHINSNTILIKKKKTEK